MGQSEVGNAGVVGIHDVAHGENIFAYITLQEGAKFPSSQDVMRFARERVVYKAPETITVLETCRSTLVARSAGQP